MSDLQPHWQNDRVTLYSGDALETLKQLPAESVHCCVTSPPYYGLRDYGVEGQIGLEQTPDEYIAKMVEVFREVRRVLRSDGTCWINIGDSYAASGRGGGGGSFQHGDVGTRVSTSNSRRAPVRGLKQKDLIGIPWMLAFALRADGWWLRQDIIWAKAVSGASREGLIMPESVEDRCAKAHEYLFLLTKSKSYYYDRLAIAEPAKDWESRDRSKFRDGTTDPKLKHHGLAKCDHKLGNRRSVWRVNPKAYKGAHFATMPPDLVEPCILAGCPFDGVALDPFAGSGTTGMVASALGRNSILIELNPQYCELIKERVATGWQKAKPKPKSVKKKPVQHESQSSLFDVLAS